MWDLNNANGPKISEDDVVDGAYSSTQAMIDCGYVTVDIIYAITSINTVEFLRVSDAICFLQLTQVSFSHDSVFIDLDFILL